MFQLPFDTTVSDVAIIRGFYATVPIPQAEDAESTFTEATSHIQALWEKYVNALPENQQQSALALTHLVISQPIILPEKFTYVDILKALLLIAIPDIRLSNQLHIGLLGKRNDEWFAGIEHDILEDKRYQLSKENSNENEKLRVCIDSFTTLVINNETDLKTDSPFYQFSAYLEAQTAFNKFTVTRFSLMLVDEVTKTIQIILHDPQIMKALVTTEIPPSQWVSILHKVFAYYLSPYILLAFANTQIKREDHEDQKKMEDALKYAQRVYHTHMSGIMVNGFQSNSEVITQYNLHTKRNINLGVSPAITAEEKTLQAVLYSDIVQARNAYLAILKSQTIEDTQAHQWTLENIMLSLGLTSDQNPMLFICNDYSFPEMAFDFPNISATTFEEDILTYFFLSNIEFIKQISGDQFGYEFYMISVERLWTAFVSDTRCQNNIKDYGITINTHTLLPSILDAINKVAAQSSLDATASNEFSDILFRSSKSKNNKLLMTLAHASLSQPSNKTNDTQILADHLSEGHLIMYLKAYLSDARQHLSENILIDAMDILLDSGLSLHNKLQFIGAIAAGRNANSTSLPKKTGYFYKKITILCAIKDISDIVIVLKDQFINENAWNNLLKLTKTTSIPTLMTLYDNPNNSPMTLSITAYHIETQCSREQLARLSELLGNATAPDTAQLGLHMRFKNSLQKIVTLIANQKSAADILSSLKKTAHKKASAKNFAANKLYSAINHFFSESNKSKNKKMEDLLACIDAAFTAPAPEPVVQACQH